MDFASLSLMSSLKKSSTIATGAEPQLARHSTNSIEYWPSGLTAMGLPWPWLCVAWLLHLDGSFDLPGSPWEWP